VAITLEYAPDRIGVGSRVDLHSGSVAYLDFTELVEPNDVALDHVVHGNGILKDIGIVLISVDGDIDADVISRDDVVEDGIRRASLDTDSIAHVPDISELVRTVDIRADEIILNDVSLGLVDQLVAIEAENPHSVLKVAGDHVAIGVGWTANLVAVGSI